jgi:hypothetical protein
MADLPVREIVLYKHGVGFFRRAGRVAGEEIALTFRREAVNDALKSLVVVDRGGGAVLGVHYQTPLDLDARAAESSIHLSDHASLRDLLRDLRGRQVALEMADRTASGRLVGVDLPGGEEEMAHTLVSLVEADGEGVSAFRLGDVRSVRLLDERAAHDLHFFLDSSLAEDRHRVVRLRLSPGEHDLDVSYVAPSPTWRVSYRVVAESDDAGKGSALLQGWGVFDNRLDEDLDGVRVTLVAGQPISFVYDLLTSRIPERPIVEDQARVAPGPVMFDAARRKRAAADEAPEAEMKAMAFAQAAAPAPARGLPGRIDREEVAGSAPPAAEGEAAGEFFEYIVTEPVSVKRGESALVPIAGTEIAYERELLYNGAKLPDHPVAALRFANETGLTLERGPVTVVEDGGYRGEAVLPFTRPGGDIYLPFAVELGVRVTERMTRRTDMAGLNVEGAYLLVEEYLVITTTYLLINTTAEPKTVTVEAPIHPDLALYETRPPDTETADARRWRVDVPAHGEAEFVRRERRPITRREEVRNLDYRRLERYFRDKWLDKGMFDRLADLLDTLAEVERAEAEKQALYAEQKQVYERQAQVRENLGALQPGGQEGVLRERMVRQMEATEDRLDAIGDRLATLDRLIDEAKARADAILSGLGDG